MPESRIVCRYLLWFLGFIVCVVSLYSAPATAQTCLHDGDVNQDGSLTPADALLVFQHFLAVVAPALTLCQQNHADVTQDANITPADALCVFRRFLSLPSCFDARLAPESGDGAHVIVNGTQRLVVRVTDASNNPVAAVPVMFGVTAGSGTLSTQRISTDTNGKATTDLTVGAAGVITVTASVADQPPSASFTVTGVAQEVARQVEVSGNNQIVNPGQVIATPFVVRVENDFGNPVAGAVVRAEIVQGDASFVTPTPVLRQILRFAASPAQAGGSTIAEAITDANGEARFLIQVGAVEEEVVTEVTFLDREPIEFRTIVQEGRECDPEPTNVLINVGDIIINCEINPISDSDRFQFEGTTGDTMVLTLVDTTIDSAAAGARPVAQLFDPAQQLVNTVTPNNAGASVQVTLAQTSTYTVLVTEAANDQPVSYTLTLQCLFGSCLP